nr:hypothetical protein [Kibdelosporangium sp. MJ126-NF4]CTQ95958.1 hypothetical protein [Kibdelosporangium sp. MJ126-NF4]
MFWSVWAVRLASGAVGSGMNAAGPNRVESTVDHPVAGVMAGRMAPVDLSL